MTDREHDRSAHEGNGSSSDPIELAERIRWPDGPVCPYCGERERVVPEADGERLRYECSACEIHRGHIRSPNGGNAAPEGAPSRRTVVPRFPRER